jgi:hypothetical protein
MPDEPPRPPDSPLYEETVRELLGEIIGCRIVGLTQHDRVEYQEDDAGLRMELQLDNGALLIMLSSTGDIRLERPDGTSITVGPIVPNDDGGLGE